MLKIIIPSNVTSANPAVNASGPDHEQVCSPPRNDGKTRTHNENPRTPMG